MPTQPIRNNWQADLLEHACLGRRLRQEVGDCRDQPKRKDCLEARQLFRSAVLDGPKRRVLRHPPYVRCN
jgi:hypothetical protein